MTDRGALVLLSGGSNSTTALFWATSRTRDVHTVAFRHGQHEAELDAARAISRLAGARSHVAIDLPTAELVAGSALLEGGVLSEPAPGRNLAVLALAAMRAAVLRADLVTGAREPSLPWGSDPRGEFLAALERAINLALPSELQPVQVHAPLVHFTPVAAVLMAHELGPACWTALGLTVTCHEGLRPGCGACPACVSRARAFFVAGKTDPAGARDAAPPKHEPKRVPRIED